MVASRSAEYSPIDLCSYCLRLRLPRKDGSANSTSELISHVLWPGEPVCRNCASELYNCRSCSRKASGWAVPDPETKNTIIYEPIAIDRESGAIKKNMEGPPRRSAKNDRFEYVCGRCRSGGTFDTEKELRREAGFLLEFLSIEFGIIFSKQLLDAQRRNQAVAEEGRRRIIIRPMANGFFRPRRSTRSCGAGNVVPAVPENLSISGNIRGPVRLRGATKHMAPSKGKPGWKVMKKGPREKSPLKGDIETRVSDQRSHLASRIERGRHICVPKFDIKSIMNPMDAITARYDHSELSEVIGALLGVHILPKWQLYESSKHMEYEVRAMAKQFLDIVPIQFRDGPPRGTSGWSELILTQNGCRMVNRIVVDRGLSRPALWWSLCHELVHVFFHLSRGLLIELSTEPTEDRRTADLLRRIRGVTQRMRPDEDLEATQIEEEVAELVSFEVVRRSLRDLSLSLRLPGLRDPEKYHLTIGGDRRTEVSIPAEPRRLPLCQIPGNIPASTFYCLSSNFLKSYPEAKGNSNVLKIRSQPWIPPADDVIYHPVHQEALNAACLLRSKIKWCRGQITDGQIILKTFVNDSMSLGVHEGRPVLCELLLNAVRHQLTTYC